MDGVHPVAVRLFLCNDALYTRAVCNAAVKQMFCSVQSIYAGLLAISRWLIPACRIFGIDGYGLPPGDYFQSLSLYATGP